MLLEKSWPGRILGPARRRAAVEDVKEVLSVSERRACRAIGQARSSWPGDVGWEPGH
jgi:hypothetical protein